MRKISIKLKVTLWYTLILAIVSSAVLFAMTSLGRSMVLHNSQEKLAETTNKISRSVTAPHMTPDKIPHFEFFNKGVHAAVYDADFNCVNGYIPLEFADEIPFVDKSFREISYNGDTYCYTVKEVKTPSDETFWIKSILLTTDEKSQLTENIKTNIAIILIFTVTAALGGYFIVRHALKPVEKINKTAAAIASGNDLSKRIAMGDGNDEVYRLADTFDNMLDKIEQAFLREKQFTSDASHELRTPLAVIMSECEYAVDCATDFGELKSSVQSIKRQTDKMSALISQLLTISRMDNDTQYIAFEQIDLSELLTFICDEQEKLHSGNITLNRNILPNVFINADRFLIMRLFVNLLSNAYEYNTENGTIDVDLTDTDDKATITITDSGIGIDDADLSNIWERFYRADPARTGTDNNNTGLGLSMVKWIAERHGGSVTVESRIGVGSRFTVTLPSA